MCFLKRSPFEHWKIICLQFSIGDDETRVRKSELRKRLMLKAFLLSIGPRKQGLYFCLFVLLPLVLCTILKVNKCKEGWPSGKRCLLWSLAFYNFIYCSEMNVRTQVATFYLQIFFIAFISILYL